MESILILVDTKLQKIMGCGQLKAIITFGLFLSPFLEVELKIKGGFAQADHSLGVIYNRSIYAGSQLRHLD